MARARGRGAEVTAKPRWDAYGGMLVLSLLAMVGGIVLLYLDYSQYPEGKPPMPQLKAAGAPAAQPAGGPAPPAGPGGPAVPPAGPGGPAAPPAGR